VAIINLDLLLPTGSSSQPESSDGPSLNAFLFDLAPDRVYQATAVTSDTGELLPHLFTVTSASKLAGGLCLFCGTFLGVAPTPRYGVSCPAEPGLSSLATWVATAIALFTSALPLLILQSRTVYAYSLSIPEFLFRFSHSPSFAVIYAGGNPGKYS